MNEVIINNWNSTVKPDDKVYLLGDVVMNKKYIPLMERLQGRITLIMGNHDNNPIELYLPHVERVAGCMEHGNMIMTHIPVHTSQFERFLGNIHGHLHWHSLPDPRYFNVSVERLDYTPIKMDVIRDHFQKIRPDFNSLGTNPSM